MTEISTDFAFGIIVTGALAILFGCTSMDDSKQHGLHLYEQGKGQVIIGVVAVMFGLILFGMKALGHLQWTP